MTLADLANIGELVAGVGVVVSLLWWERADRFGFDPRFIDHMNERLK